MQPKFTLKNLGLLAKFTALALIFVFSAQVSFSQVTPNKQEGLPQFNLLQSNNDAGLPTAIPVPYLSPTVSKSALQNRPEAVCSTINGTLQAGDPTLSGNRPFRDGVLPATCANKTCTAGVAGAGSFYDVINFTNTQSVSQCVTLTYTVTAITGGTFTFLSVHQGSFDPANTCTNYLSDCGSSPATGVPVTFSFTLAGNSTAAIVVSSVGPITSANYTLVIDGTCAPCVPTNATAPVISSVPSSTCAGSPITLNILGGSLNGAAEWRWYSGSCGGTPVGVGSSITVSPAATTTYYARGEGGCAPAAGPCASQTVTVTSCSCLTPDVATICAGSIQRIQVTPNGATTQTFVSAPGNISINASGIATPYPSTLTVAGLPASGSGVYVSNVTINGFYHTFPSDVDIVLRSPSGASVILMSDAGGATDAVDADVVFSDAAAAVLPAAIVSGTFKPTNIGTPDNFVAPGPGNLTQATPLLSMFAGTGDPNGSWQLFVVDDLGGDAGSIRDGWSITFSIVPTATWTPVTGLFTNAAATTPYVAGTQTDVVYAQPSTTTTYTATISSGPCAGANNVTVTVLPRPTIAISPATPGCAPANLTASGGSNYSWSPTSGLNAGVGAIVTATPSANTTYTVLGYGANGCSNTASVSVNGISTSSVISANVVGSTLNEGWTVAAPLPGGWSQQNLSSPVGLLGWFQGNSGVFPAQSGAPTSYIAANFNSVAGDNTISNWLFTPVLILRNGDQLKFYTRGVTASTFPDRLEVRMSTSGSSVNVGSTNTSVGDYTNLMLTINSALTVGGYPQTWTEFTATISGLPNSTPGRFAFRYFVTNGGPAGANSDYIGIDEVRYTGEVLTGVCANTVSTIGVNITGGISPYTLVFTNGTTNTTYNNYTSGTPIQVSPSATTTYSIVSVTGANGCPGVGNSGSAVIVVTPPPAISSQPSAATAACVGGNATITINSTPTGNTYQWQVSTNGGGTYTNLTNGGVYSGVTSSTLTLTGVTSAMTSYRYRAVVTGQCPSPVTSNASVLSVNTAPTITTQPASATFCENGDATFTAAATTTTGPVTYQWEVSTNGGTTWTAISGATGATLTLSGITAAMTGNQYRALVRVAPCAAVTSSVATLTVRGLPTVSIAAPTLLITPGQTATITATSNPAAQNANSYAWTLNGSPVFPAVNTNPLSVTVDGLGSYQVSVTDINGCVGTSNVIEIGGAQSDRLWIYPNPSLGQFQVRLYSTGNPTEKRVVSVYTTGGQLVERKVFELNNVNGPYLRMDFDLAKAAPGTYVVKVEDRFSKVIASGLWVKQ